MHPDTVKKLNDSDEFRELQRYLAEKALELNYLGDIALKDSNEIAVEVLARQRAYEKLTQILRDFVPQNTIAGGAGNMREYTVDVDEDTVAP